MNTLKTYLSNFQKTFDADSLNSLRSYTHNEFDQIWKFRHMTRSAAYAWLAAKLNKPKQDAHIALFNEQECRATLLLVREYLYGNCDATTSDIY